MGHHHDRPDSQTMIANSRVPWQICSIVLVAIVAALAGNTIWVDSRTRPASPRDGGSIIETGIEPGNVRIQGEGPAILLLHGFGAAINWWDDVAPSLAIHQRVIRVDLIGHGCTSSPKTGYTIPRQAQLASALLDRLG